MSSITTFLYSIAKVIYCTTTKLVRSLTDNHRAFVEIYREEFEEYVKTNPKLTGSRLARRADGTYVDDNVEKAWVTFHEARFQRDNAW